MLSKGYLFRTFALGPALLAFAQTVERGGFAAASNILKISPAAVGQSVKRLENHFGVKLLNRTTRRMSLTPDGRRLMDRSKGLLADLEEINRLFEESRGVATGPLRVSAPLGVARRQLMPLFADFSAAHPGVILEVDATDQMRDFATGAIDVGFRVLRPQDSSIIARPIADLQALTLASPGYLKRHGTPGHPRDLQHHRCIAYRFLGTGRLADHHFKIAGKNLATPFNHAMVVNDIEVGCEAATLGLGIVQPPSNYARHYVDNGQLVTLLSRYVATPWTLYLCYPDREQLPLRVRSFIDFAMAHLKKGARRRAN